MPFNGAGVFQRLYSWATDAGNGLDISAPRMDADTDDIAAALSNCITRDGQGVPSAPIAWGGQNLTGVNALTANTGAFGSITATGTASFGSMFAQAATFGDALFAMSLSSGNPTINLDTNDYIQYSRAGNQLNVVINGAGVAAYTAAGGTVTGNFNVTGSLTQAGSAVWTAATLTQAAAFSIIGYTPVQQGTGVGQNPNTLKLGWDGSKLRLTVDNTDQGGLVSESRLAGGVIPVNGTSMKRNGAEVYGSDNFVPGTNYQAPLGFTPARQGGGTGMLGNVVYIGWNNNKMLLQVDGSPLGGILTDTSGRTAAHVSDGTAAPSGGQDGDLYFQYS